MCKNIALLLLLTIFTTYSMQERTNPRCLPEKDIDYRELIAQQKEAYEWLTKQDIVELAENVKSILNEKHLPHKYRATRNQYFGTGKNDKSKIEWSTVRLLGCRAWHAKRLLQGNYNECELTCTEENHYHGLGMGDCIQTFLSLHTNQNEKYKGMIEKQYVSGEFLVTHFTEYAHQNPIPYNYENHPCLS